MAPPEIKGRITVDPIDGSLLESEGSPSPNLATLTFFFASAAEVIASLLELGGLKGVFVEAQPPALIIPESRKLLGLQLDAGVDPERFLKGFEPVASKLLSKEGPLSFVLRPDHETIVDEPHQAYIPTIIHVGVVLRETIKAVDEPELKMIAILGDQASLWIRSSAHGLCGCLAQPGEEKRARELLTELVEEPDLLLPRYPEEVLSAIRTITCQFLHEFAEPVLDRLMKKYEIDPTRPKKAAVKKLVAELEHAAGLLLGPSQGRQMADQLTEELAKF